MYNYLKLDESLVEFIPIVPSSDLIAGERIYVEIDGLPLVIFKIADQVFAIGDVCSHDDGPLGEGELNQFEITCPRHGASFDVRTGKVLSLPAIVDIPAYPVRILDGQIQVGLPK